MTTLGNKFAISLYVDERTFNAIEQKRGEERRSTFVEKVVKNAMRGKAC